MNSKTRRAFILIMIVAALLLIAPRFGKAEQEPTTNLEVVRSDTPAYPVDALVDRIDGTVIVSVHINREGKVISEKYVSGPEGLRDAAEESARFWIFNPVQRRRIRTAYLSFEFIIKTADAPAEGQTPASSSPFAVKISADPLPAVNSPVGENADDENKVGVPECDEYLRKWRECIELRMPKAALEASERSLRTTTRAWRDMARNPQTRASLGAACRAADDAARAGMTAYGCNW